MIDVKAICTRIGVTYQRKRERAEAAQSESLGYLGDWFGRTSPAWRRSAKATSVG